VLRATFLVAALEAPAFLGGAMLIAEDRLFVGLSERSNEEAVSQLQSILTPPWRIAGVPLPGDLLHLLSGCSYLGDGSLLAVGSLAGFAKEHGFTVVPVPSDEEAGANVLALESGVIVPAGYPRTAGEVAQTGRRLWPSR
jgi:dimethylargininase